MIDQSADDLLAGNGGGVANRSNQLGHLGRIPTILGLVVIHAFSFSSSKIGHLLSWPSQPLHSGQHIQIQYTVPLPSQFQSSVDPQQGHSPGVIVRQPVLTVVAISSYFLGVMVLVGGGAEGLGSEGEASVGTSGLGGGKEVSGPDELGGGAGWLGGSSGLVLEQAATRTNERRTRCFIHCLERTRVELRTSTSCRSFRLRTSS
jgi:hypothetical protein